MKNNLYKNISLIYLYIYIIMPSKRKSSKNSKNYEGEIDDDLFDEPQIFKVSRSKMDEESDGDISENENSDDEIASGKGRVRAQ